MTGHKVCYSKLLTETFSFDRILKKLVKVCEQVILNSMYMLYNSGLVSSELLLLPPRHFRNILRLSALSVNIQNSLCNTHEAREAEEKLGP